MLECPYLCLSGRSNFAVTSFTWWQQGQLVLDLQSVLGTTYLSPCLSRTLSFLEWVTYLFPLHIWGKQSERNKTDYRERGQSVTAKQESKGIFEDRILSSPPKIPTRPHSSCVPTDSISSPLVSPPWSNSYILFSLITTAFQSHETDTALVLTIFSNRNCYWGL